LDNVFAVGTSEEIESRLAADKGAIAPNQLTARELIPFLRGQNKCRVASPRAMGMPSGNSRAFVHCDTPLDRSPPGMGEDVLRAHRRDEREPTLMNVSVACMQVKRVPQ
jgi:hypothetical protein